MSIHKINHWRINPFLIHDFDLSCGERSHFWLPLLSALGRPHRCRVRLGGNSSASSSSSPKEDILVRASAWMDGDYYGDFIGDKLGFIGINGDL